MSLSTDVDADLARDRGWVREGTRLLAGALDGLPDAGLAGPSVLPGWTRAHVVAHVAANADALRNLVAWAATGVPTPMYASPEQRSADIERGAGLPADRLRTWVTESADRLAADMDGLDSVQWRAEVVTAQGRTVPATQTVWMRSREVLIHAVDLDAGIAMADLPQDFLVALATEIAAKRAGGGSAVSVTARDTGDRFEIAGAGAPVPVAGPLAGVAGWLAGRPHSGVRARDGDLPDLGPWL